jgi:shikimate dehydrogenase
MASRKLKSVAGVIGTPVSQSLSPAIHNAAFEKMGKPWRYVAIDVDATYFSDEVACSRDNGFLGLSVTMPHKDAAFALAVQCDEVAKRSRSVNTLIFTETGSIVGANTDGDGCCDALEHHGVSIEGCRVAVLGAGGTARAVITALEMRGAAEIIVINRTAEHAESAARCSSLARVGEFKDIEQAQIVINTTSVGMRSDESLVPPENLRASHVVLDAVYAPMHTRLLHDAVEVGARTIDGLWMLVYQAVRQEELWCGVRPDPRVMRDAAEREIGRRNR